MLYHIREANQKSLESIQKSMPEDSAPLGVFDSGDYTRQYILEKMPLTVSVGD